MDLGVSGKTYLIGASSDGLGFATASVLASEGAKVWIGGRDQGKLEEALRKLRSVAGSASVSGAVYDASDAGSIAAWVSHAVAAWGNGIDGILANAGGPPPGTFVDFDDAAWEGAFELVLLSAVRLFRAALPGLRERKGSALFVTSTSVTEPIDGLILSNSLRSAVAGLSKSLSREFAAEGIRANCLSPGRFATTRVERLDAATGARLGVSAEQARSKAESSIPLGRYGEPEEYGRAAAWLLSPSAAYLTGQVVTLDGGLTRGTW